MFNLKSLVLIALITFCHQDKNCLTFIERCVTTSNTGNSGSMGAGSVANCQYGYGSQCYICKSGYARSYDGTSCVQFSGCEYTEIGDNTKCSDCLEGYVLTDNQKECIKFDNCYRLVAGDNTKCEECFDHYHPNKDGKCERTLCSHYEYSNKDVCDTCFNGFYLNKDKNCVEITIENCLQVDIKDNTKCTYCVNGYYVDNGQCVVPSTLIKGCIQYDKTGKCTSCDSGYNGPNNDGTCTLTCGTNQSKKDYCYSCKKGYYLDDGICTSYVDGSKDTSSSSCKSLDYVLILFILTLLF